MPSRRLLATVLLLLLLLSGCAAGDDAGSTAASDADSSAGSTEEAPVASSGSGALADDGGGAAGRAAAMQRAVVSTGDVQLRARDVAQARAEVVRLTAAWGGSVADEQSSSDRDGRPESTTMTLRVPSERFSAAMDALGQVAELRSQSRTAENVTTEVVDVDARVRVQERSVRRIEALLEQATSVRDVISIESDLANRQGDLDSLRSQQAYLSDQTSLSTITVSVERRSSADPGDDAGFLAGLRGGWSALGGSAAALATAAGAVLPFAVLAALLLAPALAVRRVVRRRRLEA